MNSSIVHRGPDGEGIWCERHVGIGHRRLSIIDIAGGAQPMLCCNERYVIAFNGEIYNYKELRSDLVKKRYVFKTNSDTEIIPSVIDHYGVEDGLQRLRGMFAVVMYDKKRNTMLVARDFVGIKPIYVMPTKSEGWLICSELKAAMLTGRVNNQINLPAIADYLRTGHIISPQTAWKGVEELMPGSWISICDSGLTRGEFWKWNRIESKISANEAVELTETAVTESVNAHLVSDVPVACFLSGGVDSSLITALAARNLPSLETFNVSFEDAKYDEAEFARAVAAQCGSNHHEIKVNSRNSSPELLTNIIEQYDQPFGDSSCIPTFLVSKAVSEHCKVILSGDGGDEMFGGYSRYSQFGSIASMSKIPFASNAISCLGKLISRFASDLGRKLRKVGSIASKSRFEQAMGLLTYFSEQEIADMIKPELQSELCADLRPRSYERFSKIFDSKSTSCAAQIIDFEICSLLHADYLRKVDIASMANSLEVRTPFLDREIFILASSIPVSLNVGRTFQKKILKLVAEKYMPREAIYRKKQGFGIPFDTWARSREMSDFILDALTSRESQVQNFLCGRKIQSILDAFVGDAKIKNLSRYQIYQRVFMLLSLELWLRRWNPSVTL